MFPNIKKLRLYKTPNGKIPYEDWINHLKDRKAAAKIRIRLQRIELGLPGSYRCLGDELYELKENIGPGYRLYLGNDNNTILLILGGGDKNTQQRDIKKAMVYWNHYRSKQ